MDPGKRLRELVEEPGGLRRSKGGFAKNLTDVLLMFCGI